MTMNSIPINALQERYLQPHQARQRPPTTFEDLLGDSIERGFAAGHWELDALVEHLNKGGPLGPNGQPWTAESFQTLMKTLGE
ncbi:recombinase-like helix-turn-helix domain-containing protein [Polaromonas sp.]|uniref:recombinase-like helix-turn-helix domain-containing protein n=1 Tax=Polaromonas sp. TaxID=1869339 RepID=UPI0025CECEDC|nr:recombinase-like helix-turn-helix domain-containing protein [Polaromonas sp.]